MFDSVVPTLPEPPAPRDGRTLQRWSHTRLRRRMLYGCWEQDLDERLRTAIGNVRKEAWGSPDLSANPFRSAMTELAVLYDLQPTVSHNDASAGEISGALERGGHWQLMQRVQRDTLGLREMFVRVDIVDGPDGVPEVLTRPAFPDLVEAKSTAASPERPVYLREALLRTVGGEQIWTYDEFDVRDPINPRFRVLDERDRDISAHPDVQLAGLSGEGYSWRRSDGSPLIPFATYHAAKTGTLFDPYEGRELVEGSLTVAVYWTMFGHVVRASSWRQRYVLNARLAAAEQVGADGARRTRLEADPSIVLELESDEEASGSVMIGSFDLPVAPAELQEAIALYERRVAAFAGISPSDIQRVAGDPRSGYALAISREGKREAQRRFEPQFRRGDEEVLALAGALMNRELGTNRYPEDGYRVAYESLPPSAEERQSEREHILALIQAGLMDRVSAYQKLHPGLSRADAERQLGDIAATNARFRVG